MMHVMKSKGLEPSNAVLRLIVFVLLCALTACASTQKQVMVCMNGLCAKGSAGRLPGFIMTLRYAIAVVVVACAACVSPVLIAPPSPELRARMDQVVLEVSASGRPNWISENTVKTGTGDRAASAAGKGARAGLYPLVAGCVPEWQGAWILTCPLGIAVGAGTAAVGGLGGGIYGAATARSQAELDSAEGALDKLLQEIQPQELLRIRIASGIRSKTSVSVFEVETHEALVERWGHAASSGVALVVNIHDFSISRKGEMSPDLWLDLTVSARLYDSPADSALYTREWGLRTDLGDFFRLTSAGAAKLGTRLDAEIDKMAAAIVDDLFVTKAAKPRQSVPDNGRVVSTGG